MRIVHCVDRIDPADGGPPAVAVRLAAAQARRGHQLGLISHTPRCSQQELQDSYGAIAGYTAIAQQYFDAGSFHERLSAARARDSLPQRLGRPDFVHLHGIWRPLLLRIAQHCQALGVPYAVTPHGMLKSWAMSQKRLKKYLGLTLGWRQVLERARVLHFLNEAERAEAAPLRLPTPGVVIPNGVDVAEINRGIAGNPAFQATLPGRYVLFLARLHYSKGLDLLIGAFERCAARYPDVHLVIAGADFGYRPQLEELIGASGLQARIHLLGGVYGEDKLQLLRNATCLCHPTRQEGFSMTLLESLASSVPVITTPEAHFPDIALEGAGIVCAADADSLARAVSAVLEDESRRTRMGIAAQRLVGSRYDWSVIADRMTQACLAAAAGTPRSAAATGRGWP
jgi:glycosyltransferase involved in cell wall biosynthesis